MDAKAAGDALVAVGKTHGHLGGSHFAMLFGSGDAPQVPVTDLQRGPQTARQVHAAIAGGLVRSAHDCSDGGLLVAAAEMAMAGGLGLELELDDEAGLFSEEPSRYLLAIEPKKLAALVACLDGLPCTVIGRFNDSGRLSLAGGQLDVALEALNDAWLGALDW
jgi:phosphoribosylformylglycinamidine synthase